MVKDTATAQNCKEIKRTVSWKEWLLVSPLAGVFILKVWSCLCCQELKTGHSCKAAKELAKALRYSKFRHPSAFHIMNMMILAPVLHLFSDHSESSLPSQWTAGDHRPLMPPKFLREGCKAKTSNLFNTTLLDYPCRPRGFTLAFKKIFPIIISMRYSGSLDSEPYLTLRRYMDQGIYFQCL